MKVRQHIPNFFSGFEPYEGEVDSLENLQALEFVERWSTDPGFYRFSVHYAFQPDSQTHLLMGELDQGKRWYVVAYLKGDPTMLQALPEWTGAE